MVDRKPLGIIMVQEQLEQYILRSKTFFRPNASARSTPNVPKLACRTCHQGEQQASPTV